MDAVKNESIVAFASLKKHGWKAELPGSLRQQALDKAMQELCKEKVQTVVARDLVSSLLNLSRLNRRQNQNTSSRALLDAGYLKMKYLGESHPDSWSTDGSSSDSNHSEDDSDDEAPRPNIAPSFKVSRDDVVDATHLTTPSEDDLMDPVHIVDPDSVGADDWSIHTGSDSDNDSKHSDSGNDDDWSIHTGSDSDNDSKHDSDNDSKHDSDSEDDENPLDWSSQNTPSTSQQYPDWTQPDIDKNPSPAIFYGQTHPPPTEPISPHRQVPHGQAPHPTLGTDPDDWSYVPVAVENSNRLNDLSDSLSNVSITQAKTDLLEEQKQDAKRAKLLDKMSNDLVEETIAEAHGELTQSAETKRVERLRQWMDSAKNYYEVLGVARNADNQTIRKMYLKLSKLYHPDKLLGVAWSSEAQKFLTSAYTTLMDPERRIEYDQTLAPIDEAIHQMNQNPEPSPSEVKQKQEMTELRNELHKHSEQYGPRVKPRTSVKNQRPFNSLTRQEQLERARQELKDRKTELRRNKMNVDWKDTDMDTGAGLTRRLRPL